MPERRKWNRQELLVALKIYCELEFGQFHALHPRIIEIASFLNRTPSALAMKLCNFASLDPSMMGKGLKRVSKADTEIIENFLANPEVIILESGRACTQLMTTTGNDDVDERPESFVPDYRKFGETEKVSEVKTRTVQQFFRSAVVSSYHFKCAICELSIKDLLIASHIVPWAEKVESRADPSNGISLCALHDKAFDRGLMTVDQDHRILISPKLKSAGGQVIADMFSRFENEKLHLPFRFAPNVEYLNWHQEHRFQS